MSSEGDNSTYDVIVVGAGPLGLSAAYQCAVKSHQRVLVIERFTSGTLMVIFYLCLPHLRIALIATSICIGTY